MKKNVLLLISVSLLLLLAGELMLRISGRYETYVERNDICPYVSPFSAHYTSPYHVYQPGDTIQNTVPFPEHFVTNNEGCRDIVFTTLKSRYRILMLGDSFTEGIGASNDSTCSRQLSAIYRKNGYDVEVWNAGISGSDPIFAYKWYRDKLCRYNPDLIILTVNSSDMDDIKIRGGFERFGKQDVVTFRDAPWFEGIYARSFLFRTVIHDIFRYDWQFITPSRMSEENKIAKAHIIAAIDSFRVLTEAYDAKLMVVVHPNFYEFSTDKKFNTQDIQHYCQQQGILFSNIHTCLTRKHIGVADAKEYYWEIDGHFNNKGYGEMAGCIYERLMSSGMY